MKLFISYLVVAATLSWAQVANADQLKADIDITPFWNNAGELNIHVGTYVKKKDFNRIYKTQAGVIEVRFYVQGEKGNEKKIEFTLPGSNERIDKAYLEFPADEVDLDNQAICPAPGQQTLRAALTVRENSGRRSPHDLYLDEEKSRNGQRVAKVVSESVDYYCPEKSKTGTKNISFAGKEPPTLWRVDDKNGDRSYQLSVSYNEDQYKYFKENDMAYVLRLYASKSEGSRTLKYKVNREYYAPASDKDTSGPNRSPYTYSVKDICEGASTFWEALAGKQIGLSCEISVDKNIGGKKVRDYRYRSYVCPTVWVNCPSN